MKYSQTGVNEKNGLENRAGERWITAPSRIQMDYSTIDGWYHGSTDSTE